MNMYVSRLVERGYQMLCLYSCSSWRWACQGPKHVEDNVTYMFILYLVVYISRRLTKNSYKIIHFCCFNSRPKLTNLCSLLNVYQIKKNTRSVMYMSRYLLHTQWYLWLAEAQETGPPPIRPPHPHPHSIAGTFYLLQVLDIKDARHCKHFLLKTGFHSIQVPSNTGFTIYIFIVIRHKIKHKILLLSSLPPVTRTATPRAQIQRYLNQISYL